MRLKAKAGFKVECFPSLVMMMMIMTDLIKGIWIVPGISHELITVDCVIISTKWVRRKYVLSLACSIWTKNCLSHEMETWEKVHYNGGYFVKVMVHCNKT